MAIKVNSKNLKSDSTGPFRILRFSEFDFDTMVDKPENMMKDFHVNQENVKEYAKEINMHQKRERATNHIDVGCFNSLDSKLSTHMQTCHSKILTPLLKIIQKLQSLISL